MPFYKGHLLHLHANILVYYLTSEHRTPLYKGQFPYPQGVHYLEVPLYYICTHTYIPLGFTFPLNTHTVFPPQCCCNMTMSVNPALSPTPYRCTEDPVY